MTDHILAYHGQVITESEAAPRHAEAQACETTICIEARIVPDDYTQVGHGTAARIPGCLCPARTGGRTMTTDADPVVFIDRRPLKDALRYAEFIRLQAEAKASGCGVVFIDRRPEYEPEAGS
jgi:hypothetical protein